MKKYTKIVFLLILLLIVYKTFFTKKNTKNKNTLHSNKRPVEKYNSGKIICSMSTIPERIEKGTIEKTLKSIDEQTLKPDIIYINISRELKGKKYDIENLQNISDKYKNIKINIIEKDMGPITKIVPILKFLNENDKVILVDDDVKYDPKTFELLYNSNKDAVGFTGLIATRNGYDYIHDVENEKEVDVLETYHCVMYSASLLKDLEFYNENLGDLCYFQDDIKLSKYFSEKGIKKYVIPKCKNMKTEHNAEDTPELRNDNLQNGNKNCLRILFPKFN